MNPAVKVGVLGVGNMGAAMAGSLLRAGHRVVVCDTDESAVDRLRQQGASSARTPAELGTMPGLSAVVSMLPSSTAVREAYLGAAGLLTGEPHTLHPRLLIDSSTIDPVTAREVAQAAESTLLHPAAAATYGHRYAAMIDAPVSGGVPGAQAAALTFMCGGDAVSVEAARPLLMAMGKRLIHCGEHGSGQAAKLANNLVLAISMAGVAEGLAFGRRLGLDPKLLSHIFDTSSAQCWVTTHYNPCPGTMEGVPSSRGYQGGFSSALMVKDLDLALQAAALSGSGLKLPMAGQARRLYQELVKKAGPGLDFSAIFDVVYGM